jgi:membrane associated rhomboid family serine protease
VFPLSDESPPRVTPIVTWFIIGACFLVFLWQSSLGAKAGEIALYQYGMIPARLFGVVQLAPSRFWSHDVCVRCPQILSD